jgi:hypothetical protein
VDCVVSHPVRSPWVVSISRKDFRHLRELADCRRVSERHGRVGSVFQLANLTCLSPIAIFRYPIFLEETDFKCTETGSLIGVKADIEVQIADVRVMTDYGTDRRPSRLTGLVSSARNW